MTLEPGSPEWQERVDSLLAKELQEVPRWWWLSFADTDGFLGVVIVHAHGMISATSRCHQLGINPGGEIAGFPLPDEAASSVEPFCDVLLSRSDLEKAGLI